jgi:gliding motility-associated protein GldM
MKRAVLVLGLVFSSIIILAQVSGKSAVFNVVKATKVIAVAPTKMAVLYIGVDNPIDIAISDIPIKYVTATVDSGEVENKGEGKFIVRVTSRISVTKINVFASYNGVMTKIGEKLFRVKRVPDPIASIANVNSGIIAKDQLVAANGIIPVMKDFDFEMTFTITSFTMTINCGGDLIEYKSVGNKLSPSVISKIQKAAKGTKVYFEDIMVAGPDGVSRTLAPINLKLI